MIVEVEAEPVVLVRTTVVLPLVGVSASVLVPTTGIRLAVSSVLVSVLVPESAVKVALLAVVVETTVVVKLAVRVMLCSIGPGAEKGGAVVSCA